MKWGSIMAGHQFEDDVNRSLVRGIENGYSNYAKERSDKRKSLYVSGAYAWVKGNHIEDQVARELKKLNISYTKEKAGYTWEYLRFNDVDKKTMFLIKGANIIKDRAHQSILDTDNPENYLVELSQINSDIDFSEIHGFEQGTMELFDLPNMMLDNNKMDALKKEYNKFYILTYNIDIESRMLSRVDLWMPDFQGDCKVEMVKVDSLSEYLGNSGAEINRDAINELSKSPEEEVSGTPTEFDYRAVERQEKESK